MGMPMPIPPGAAPYAPYAPYMFAPPIPGNGCCAPMAEQQCGTLAVRRQLWTLAQLTTDASGRQLYRVLPQSPTSVAIDLLRRLRRLPTLQALRGHS